MLLASVGLTGGGAMGWSALAQCVALPLDVLMACRRSEGAKDLEIAVLRHQLRMLERRLPCPRLSRWERLTLALLATKLRHVASDARQCLTRCLVLVEPATVLRWHRDLVRRTWTFRSGARAGRASLDAKLEGM